MAAPSGDAGAGPEAGLDLAAALVRSEEDVRYPIGSALPLGVLRAVDFLELPGCARQVEDLSRSNYVHFRRVRPDGDCFYRALCFAWLEVINDRIARGRTVELPPPGGWPDSALFGELTPQFSELREQIMQLPSQPQLGQRVLARLMVDYRFDLCAVVLVRLLVASFWREAATAQKGHAPAKAMAVESLAQEVARHGGIDDFVRNKVLPLGREAMVASISAAAAQLGVHLCMVHLDGSTGPPPERAYPLWEGDGAKPLLRVSLLRRSPWQYEVVYRREMPFFVDGGTLLARCSSCHEQAELSARGVLGCTHRLCQSCSRIESECCVCLQDQMEQTALSSLELARGCLPDDGSPVPASSPRARTTTTPRKASTASAEETIGILRSLGMELADEGCAPGNVSPKDTVRMQDKLAKRRALLEGEKDGGRGGSDSPSQITDGRSTKPSRKTRLEYETLAKALDRACAELQKLTEVSSKTSDELTLCSAARRDAQIEAFSLKAELRTEESIATGLSEEHKEAELASGQARAEVLEHGTWLSEARHEAMEVQRALQFQSEEEQSELLQQLAERSRALETCEAAGSLEREALLGRLRSTEAALEAEEAAVQAREEATARQEILMQQWAQEQERLLQQLSESSAALQASKASLADESTAHRSCKALEERLARSEVEATALGEEVHALTLLRDEHAAETASLEEALQARVTEAHDLAASRLEFTLADSTARVSQLRAELAATEGSVSSLAASCEQREADCAGLMRELEAQGAEHTEECKQLRWRYQERGEAERQAQVSTHRHDEEREALAARLELRTASLRCEESSLQASYAEQALVVERCMQVVVAAESEAEQWERSCARYGTRETELEEAVRRAASERAALLQSLQTAEAERAAAVCRLEEASAAEAAAAPAAGSHARVEPPAEASAAAPAAGNPARVELPAEALPPRCERSVQGPDIDVGAGGTASVEEEPQPPPVPPPEGNALAATPVKAAPREVAVGGGGGQLGSASLKRLRCRRFAPAVVLAALVSTAAFALWPTPSSPMAPTPARPHEPSPASPYPPLVPTSAPEPAPKIDTPEVRRLRRELEARRLRREALEQAGVSIQRRAVEARKQVGHARAAMAAATGEEDKAERAIVASRERLRELQASQAGMKKADSSQRSATEQQILAGLAGVFGAFTVLGSDGYVKGFNAITGSAVGGLLVSNCMVFLQAQSFFNDGGWILGYIVWAVLLALGITRWYVGFECKLWASTDEVLMTQDGVVVMAPDDDMRRLGPRPTVFLPLMWPSCLLG